LIEVSSVEFTAFEIRVMRYLAGAAIPAADEKSLPGGDEEEIFKRLLTKAASRASRIKPLIESSLKDVDGEALDSDDAKLKAWCEHLVSHQPQAPNNPLSRLLPLILQAYYEDHRVQQAYQRRPGPPFPEGYEVSQGDWSLLDPVRDRQPFYRKSK